MYLEHGLVHCNCKLKLRYSHYFGPSIVPDMQLNKCIFPTSTLDQPAMD